MDLARAIPPLWTSGMAAPARAALEDDGRSLEASPTATVVTADKKPSAHYENTIAITNGAPMFLTLSETEAKA